MDWNMEKKLFRNYCKDCSKICARRHDPPHYLELFGMTSLLSIKLNWRVLLLHFFIPRQDWQTAGTSSHASLAETYMSKIQTCPKIPQEFRIYQVCFWRRVSIKLLIEWYWNGTGPESRYLSSKLTLKARTNDFNICFNIRSILLNDVARCWPLGWANDFNIWFNKARERLCIQPQAAAAVITTDTDIGTSLRDLLVRTRIPINVESGGQKWLQLRSFNIRENKSNVGKVVEGKFKRF